jgi:hypothetical protein
MANNMDRDSGDCDRHDRESQHREFHLAVRVQGEVELGAARLAGAKCAADTTGKAEVREGEMTKRCTKCGEVKELLFYKYKKYKNHGKILWRYSSWCNKCEYLSRNSWSKRNKDKVANYQKKSFAKNKEKIIERLKERRAKESTRFKEYQKTYKNRYPDCENVITINGIRFYKRTVLNELKSMIETLIMLRNKKNLYRRIQDGE